jgi:zinc protease
MQGGWLRRRRSVACAFVAWLVAALAGSLGVGAAVRAFEGVTDPALRTRVTRLDNGLSILSLEDHTTPTVTFQVWVRVGSGDESRYTGLAHLFEHMMFRGTRRLGSEAHERLIEERGGRVNAFTSLDVTVYFEDVTAEHLPLVIELEAERLAHLDISEASLESERQVVLEERRLRTEDSPEGRAYEALRALTFRAHPYRVPPIGWRSDVEAATVEVCREFFHTYYAPNNLVIAVVGDFDEADTLARIERAFGSLEPVGEIPRNPTREPEQRGERREVIHFDVKAPLVAAAWQAPGAGHPDAEALDAASEILSGGRSSRLYRRLVYDGQQALGVQTGYDEMERAGVFEAFASVRPDATVARVEALLLEEITRLRDGLVSPAELEKAKRSLEVRLLAGLGTSHALAFHVASDFVLLGRVRPLAERLEAIRAVGAGDVQRVARTWLRDDGRNLVHLVPPPSPAAGSAR